VKGSLHMEKSLCLAVLALAATSQTTFAADSQCLAAIVGETAGSQIGSETGTTTLLAEAFIAPATQVVSEVQLKLDAVTPPGTTLGSTISVQIMPDALLSDGQGVLNPTPT
jgi:hypothetical protein